MYQENSSLWSVAAANRMLGSPAVMQAMRKCWQLELKQAVAHSFCCCSWQIFLLPCVLDCVAASSAQAERQAVNTICQGSAADLVKLAMIQLHKQLQQQLPAEACRLLLQVMYLLTPTHT